MFRNVLNRAHSGFTIWLTFETQVSRTELRPVEMNKTRVDAVFVVLLSHFLLFITFFPTILPLNADAVKRESNKWTEERNWPNKRDLDFVCCWDKAALSTWLLLKLGWTPPLLLKVVKIKLRSSSICSHSLWGSLFMPDWGYYQAMDTIILRVFILLPHCWKFACFKYESEKDIK